MTTMWRSFGFALLPCFCAWAAAGAARAASSVAARATVLHRAPCVQVPLLRPVTASPFTVWASRRATLYLDGGMGDGWHRPGPPCDRAAVQPRPVGPNRSVRIHSGLI